jgi:hypothetical protein
MPSQTQSASLNNTARRDYAMQLSAARMNRRFDFVKRRQLLIGPDDKTLSVAMSVDDPDRLPFAIHS